MIISIDSNPRSLRSIRGNKVGSTGKTDTAHERIVFISKGGRKGLALWLALWNKQKRQIKRIRESAAQGVHGRAGCVACLIAPDGPQAPSQRLLWPIPG